MRKSILSVIAAMTLLFGGAMMFFAPSATADTPAGTSVFTVGSDSITLRTPTGLAYSDPAKPTWNYVLEYPDGHTFVCGNENGNGSLCGASRTVSLSPGDYTLYLVIDLGQFVDTDTFTIGADPTVVTPASPTQSGNEVTIPTVTCVTYLVNGSPVTGTITITKDTTVTATPGAGCEFSSGATDSWTYQYTPPTPDPTVVTPAAPTQNGNDVTIPSDPGVVYLVNGSPVTGTITLTEDTTVTADPAKGYVFPGGATDSWTYQYTPPTPDPTVVTPATPTQDGNKVTIPTVAGVVYSVNGSPVTGTITITKDTTVTASPTKGYVFPGGATDSWTYQYTAPTPDPDPVFDPTASVVLNDDGSGVATLDNTGSTEPVGYEVVVNGEVTSVTVPAGETMTVPFGGAECDTTVVVNALDAPVAQEAMPACPATTPTPDPDDDPTNPTTDPTKDPAPDTTSDPTNDSTPAPNTGGNYVAPSTGEPVGNDTHLSGLLLVGMAGVVLAFAGAGWRRWVR